MSLLAVVYEQLTERDAEVAALTAALAASQAECAEWKARFDALLLRTPKERSDGE